MLENSALNTLSAKKNLLAFSAGGDSTALLFLLLKFKIKFDIAIVNYSTREQSIQELRYAQELAKKYNFSCHSLNAPKIEKNFEANAREIRYNFFEKIILEFHYENLLTAHHLGDRFEWMLMQFCKGAGCVELSGMQKVDKRDRYTLLRPLLHLEKKELLHYLHKEKIHYFEDETNLDEAIKRNSFRHKYSKPLLEAHLSGIKKSFDYLDEDRSLLVKEVEIQTIGDFSYFSDLVSSRSNIYTIDKHLKTLGLMISAQERELLKSRKSLIVARKFLISYTQNYIFISPYSSQKVEMPHRFKEECRVLQIDPKLRPYLYEKKEIFLKVKELITQ